MSKKQEQQVEAIATPVAEKLGLEIEYVEYVKEGGINILRVVIDRPQGLTSIEDCESISRLIEDEIEKKVDIKTEYTLEVSSPGLERQIKSERLYKKYINETIRFSLYKQVEGKKVIVGKIKELNDENIIVEEDGKVYDIERKNIANAATYYDFSQI